MVKKMVILFILACFLVPSFSQAANKDDIRALFGTLESIVNSVKTTRQTEDYEEEIERERVLKTIEERERLEKEKLELEKQRLELEKQRLSEVESPVVVRQEVEVPYYEPRKNTVEQYSSDEQSRDNTNVKNNSIGVFPLFVIFLILGAISISVLWALNTKLYALYQYEVLNKGKLILMGLGILVGVIGILKKWFFGLVPVDFVFLSAGVGFFLVLLFIMDKKGTNIKYALILLLTRAVSMIILSFLFAIIVVIVLAILYVLIGKKNENDALKEKVSKLEKLLKTRHIV